MKHIPDFLGKNGDSKDIVVYTEQYKELLVAVSSCTDIYLQFFTASIVYKKFKRSIHRLESKIRERLVPRYDHDGSYTAMKHSFCEAVGCSEEIHRQLCLHYNVVVESVGKKKLLLIIEKWATIHLRLWVLGLQKGIIE